MFLFLRFFCFSPLSPLKSKLVRFFSTRTWFPVALLQPNFPLFFGTNATLHSADGFEVVVV